MRKLILALSAAALALPATPAAALIEGQQQQAQSWRGSDGRVYCKRPNGTTGMAFGGAAGLLGGRSVGRQGDRTPGGALGGALGALLGRQVQREMLSRCR